VHYFINNFRKINRVKFSQNIRLNPAFLYIPSLRERIEAQIEKQ